MVDQALFVDRDAQIEAILAAIGMRLNVFVSGEPGSGKTSLLRRLEMILTKEQTPVAFVNVDASTSAYAAIDTIATAISPDFDTGSSWRTIADDETDLETLEEAILTRAEEHLVLLVDGVNEEVMMTLFGRYRDRLWQSPKLIWVVAARMVAPAPPGDAFFDRVIELDPLSEAAVEELLERRASGIDQDDRRQLSVALGPVQPLVALLRAQTLALSTDPDSVLEAILAYRLLAQDLPGRLQSLHEALLSVGPTHAGDERLLARLGTSRPRVVSGLKELEKQGLVRSDREGRRQIYAVTLHPTALLADAPAQTMLRLGEFYLEQGKLNNAAKWFWQVTATESGTPNGSSVYHFKALQGLSQVAILDGRLDDARDLLEVAVNVGERAGMPLVDTMQTLGRICEDLGETEVAEQWTLRATEASHMRQRPS